MRYLWAWFTTLSDCTPRIRNGVCSRIPPTEFQAWKEASGIIVYPVEYAILCAMDRAFCVEMNKELAAYQERLRLQATQDAKG